MAACVIALIFSCINNNVLNSEDKGRFGWVFFLLGQSALSGHSFLLIIKSP